MQTDMLCENDTRQMRVRCRGFIKSRPRRLRHCRTLPCECIEDDAEHPRVRALDEALPPGRPSPADEGGGLHISYVFVCVQFSIPFRMIICDSMFEQTCAMPETIRSLMTSVFSSSASIDCFAARTCIYSVYQIEHEDQKDVMLSNNQATL